MNNKIAWLEELLAVEPNSKQFFPLAQSYVQADRIEDALALLYKGLTFHPEHLGARLLLIQCLARQNNAKEADKETAHVARSLTGCPVFWDLWAEQSGKAGKQDMAVALRLLGRFLAGEAIQWGQILEQGLKAVILPMDESGAEVQPETQRPQWSPKAVAADTPAEQPAGQPPGQPADDAPSIQDHAAAEDADLALAEPLADRALFDATGDETQSDIAEQATTGPDPAQADALSARIQARIPLPRPEDIPGYDRLERFVSPAVQEYLSRIAMESEPTPADAGEGSEGLSESELNYYETRTYADLLADQGEVQEALEVYNRLLRASADIKHRRDLKKRIRALKEAASRPQTHGGPQKTEPDNVPAADNPQSASRNAQTPAAPAAGTRPAVVQTLTRLAERLEARGRS